MNGFFSDSMERDTIHDEILGEKPVGNREIITPIFTWKIPIVREKKSWERKISTIS